MSAVSRDPGGSKAGNDSGHTSRGESDAELRRLGRVTSELLHDLGGILGVLSGRVSLAREEASLGRIPSEELRRIQGDTDELRRMVVEILEEIRGRPRSLEVTFPVSTTLDESVKRWLAGAPSVNTTLRSTLAPNAEVAGPRSFFTRSIGNLLRNAARHARSEIRITVRPDVTGNAVQIMLEDDGAGVAPEVRERVFEPFVSASDSGTGLGLSFARWGIERLGGTVELSEAPTELGGAAFTVTLPLSTLPRAHSRRETSDRPGRDSAGTRPGESLAGIRVAVVDDDRAVRTTLSRLLARSGADAVGIDPAHWRSAEAASLELRAMDPDVILLDVNLGRVSGAEVAGALRTHAPDLVHRLLFMTGGAPPGSLDRFEVISKMVGWNELVSRILRLGADSRDEA